MHYGLVITQDYGSRKKKRASFASPKVHLQNTLDSLFEMPLSN